MGRHGHGKLGKLLRHGELKLIILYLLEKAPRHGYEIIKELEVLSSGAYTPSPGSIYPTLTFLDESGLATSTKEDNKKLYSITKSGQSEIENSREKIEELVHRFSRMGEKISKLQEWMGREEIEEVANINRPSIRRSMHRLKSELYSFVEAKGEAKREVVKTIDNAIREIQEIKDKYELP